VFDKIGVYRDASAGSQPDQAVYLDNFSYATTYADVVATFPHVVASRPANTAPPGITGTPIVGGTLTASTGTWSGSPTSYAYQWRRCDLTGANCTSISGATSQSYTVGQGDAGYTIRVTVTAANGAGSTSATSSPTSLVAPSTSITTNLRGYRTGSDYEKVAITSSGALTTNVNIYRNGSFLTETANTGAYTDSLHTKAPGSYTYHVCEAGSAICSSNMTVTFTSTTVTVTNRIAAILTGPGGTRSAHSRALRRCGGGHSRRAVRCRQRVLAGLLAARSRRARRR
jgi:hypothetical protein